MPKFLIDKLKKEYPNNPSAVYGTLNSLGMMHGNKETAKGRAAQAKHEKDSHMKAKKHKHPRIEIENVNGGGHIVSLHQHQSDGPGAYKEPDRKVFEDSDDAVEHVKKAMGMDSSD